MTLRLEPITEYHVPLVEQWLEDPESRRRVGGMIPFRSCFDYQQTNPDYHEWIVLDAGTPVGLVSFEKYEDGSAALVLLVRPGARNRGYGQSTLKLLRVEAALASVKVLVAPVEPDHESCIRCLRAAGFVNGGPDPEDKEFLRFVCDLQPKGTKARAHPCH